MIERWFPCAEVSGASASGWGSGNSERALFTWFAARPLAQAKAAVLTSLLPWPDDTHEQHRLQRLVRDAMTGRDVAHDRLVAELHRHYPDGASLLDPFSGRAMIPLEAARLGVRARGVDYSPVATLAGRLLADYPLRDWTAEPPLPWRATDGGMVDDRLTDDVTGVLAEVGRRYAIAMGEFYPNHEGAQPWGYLWGSTLPCQECGRRFPVVGSLALQYSLGRGDAGQAYRLLPDGDGFTAEVHDGPPREDPTLRSLGARRGKSAVCLFCGHVHPVELHTRLSADGLRDDVLLLAADMDEQVGKRFRLPTSEERDAAAAAEAALRAEPPFGPGLPAVPNEKIPAGNNDTVRASKYGARTYGDLCNQRQTLGFVRLARITAGLGEEIRGFGASDDYAVALCSYAGSVMVRKLRYSTRGAALQVYRSGRQTSLVKDIFGLLADVSG